MCKSVWLCDSWSKASLYRIGSIPYERYRYKAHRLRYFVMAPMGYAYLAHATLITLIHEILS
jgi:hypothetical protein